MKATVVFQGVTQVTTENETADRAINQGGGYFEVRSLQGDFFAHAGVVCLAGKATPTKVWAVCRNLFASGA